MGTTHVVQQGECLSQIAAGYGFADYTDVYNHPDNDDFRQLRPNPNLIQPGDQVQIPDLDKKSVDCPTGASYNFQVTRPKRKLKVQIQDTSGKPIASQPYTLVGTGLSATGQSTSAGFIEADLPIDLNVATLTIGTLVRTLHIGHLNPLRDVDDGGVSGVQARLANLGFNPGTVDGIYGPRTAAAITAYQKANGMDQTGQIDDALLSALDSDHGC
jgi:Putative peptidoglycan binding domain